MKVNLSLPLTVHDLCHIFGHPCSIDGETKIESVVTHSKEAQTGSLFVALRGEKEDGHSYLRDAVSRGATAILTEEPIGNCPENAVQLIVDDTVVALGEIASFYKSRFRVKTIAITGSVGKTTTRSFLSHMLKSRYRVHSTEGNYNNHIGVPMTILNMPEQTEILLLEMGMNHKGEIGYLSRMAKPDIAIITAVGHAHIGLLGSVEAIYRAKLEITQGMNGGVLLLPDNMSDYFQFSGIKQYLCGQTEQADYQLKRAQSTILLPNGEEVAIRQKSNALPFQSALLYAVAVCDILGFSKQEMEAFLPLCPLPKSRLEDIWIGGIHLIDDAYNSSPESMREALLYTTGQGAKRKMALIGDMLELGERAGECHLEVGRQLADLKFDEIWLVGDFAEWIKEGAVEHHMDASHIHIGDRESCVCHLAQTLHSGDTLLIKGSHESGLWAAAESLSAKLKKEIP